MKFENADETKSVLPGYKTYLTKFKHLKILKKKKQQNRNKFEHAIGLTAEKALPNYGRQWRQSADGAIQSTTVESTRPDDTAGLSAMAAASGRSWPSKWDGHARTCGSRHGYAESRICAAPQFGHRGGRFGLRVGQRKRYVIAN